MMKKKHFYAAAILLLFLAVGIQPALAYTWVISFGQEYTFGEWEGTTFKFDSSTPVGDSIIIGEDNVIIDGAGYTVNSGSSPQTNGVFVQEKSYVTIKNLKVQNFDTGIKILSSHNITLTGNEVSGCNAGQFSSGIYLSYAYESDLTENTVSNNSYGIHLQYMYSNLEAYQGNTLTNNTALDNTYGIALSSNYYSILTSNTVSGNGQGINIYGYGPPDKPGNTLTNNNASNNDFGIRLHTAKSNTLTGNSVVSNTIGGIYLTNSHDNTVENNTISNNGFGIKLNPSDYNKIYNNNFIENTPQAEVVGGDGNEFNLGDPTEGGKGGNYWSDWSGSGPYIIVPDILQDEYPWATQDGWSDPTPPIIITVNIEEAKVSWDHSDIHVDGKLYLPQGFWMDNLIPVGRAVITLAEVGVADQIVGFKIAGKKDDKWEYKDKENLNGPIKEFKIDWKGAKFDYKGDDKFHIHTHFISGTETTLCIHTGDVSGAFTVTINGTTIAYDEDRIITTDVVYEPQKDDNTHVHFTLPFQLNPDMTIEVSDAVVLSIAVADYYEEGFVKFKLVSVFDSGMFPQGTGTSPDTLKCDISLDDMLSGSDLIDDWTKKDEKQWNYNW